MLLDVNSYRRCRPTMANQSTVLFAPVVVRPAMLALPGIVRETNEGYAGPCRFATDALRSLKQPTRI